MIAFSRGQSQSDFADVLAFPSPEAFSYLLSLYRENGPYYRAALRLGLKFDSSRVPLYFSVRDNALYIDETNNPISSPKGFFASIKIAYFWQKLLREYPKQFYMNTNVESVEDLYAFVSLLSRIAFTTPYILGCPIHEIWFMRETWLRTQPSVISTMDFELTLTPATRVRTTWKEPNDPKDLFAILREDAKDLLRPTLERLHYGLDLKPKSGEVCPAMPIKKISVKKIDTVETSFRGVSVSKGVAEGVVGGTILVMKTLTPERCKELHSGVRGVVTETGGLMSHGALICREMNIPAVFAVKNATELFLLGEKIFVDGNKGMVKRVGL